MPIAIVLLGLVVQSLGAAGQDQQDIEGRTEALTNGQIGLEKMTHELRQANWVYFRSSSVVDLDVSVRSGPTASGTSRLVRFDCSGETCTRSEGPPVAYPPSQTPSFSQTRTLIGSSASDVGGRDGQVVGHDVFSPAHVDPDTGTSTTNFVNPDYVSVRLQLAFRDRHLTAEASKDHPIVVSDGVSLRNRTTFADG